MAKIQQKELLDKFEDIADKVTNVVLQHLLCFIKFIATIYVFVHKNYVDIATLST